MAGAHVNSSLVIPILSVYFKSNLSFDYCEKEALEYVG